MAYCEPEVHGSLLFMHGSSGVVLSLVHRRESDRVTLLSLEEHLSVLLGENQTDDTAVPGKEHLSASL